MLSYLRGDEGGAVVQRVLQQCRDCETRMAIPASHLLEAYAVAVREAPALLDDLISLVDQLPLEVCPVTKETAEAAAELVASRPELKPERAAAMAFCGRNGTTLVTADPGMADQPGCLYVGPRAGNPGG
jgi:predicted nucleic acid-binding protein